MTRVVKGILFFTFVGLFFLTGAALKAVFRTESVWRRANQLMCEVYSRIALLILNIDLQVIESSGSRQHLSKGTLYLCNHMSYTDIMVISAWLRCSFVTSVEIRDTPFLGHMCRIAGCLFVERRNRSQIENEIGEISMALRNGFNVMIFPEATSTNGDDVLPFKRSLIKSAIDAGADVQPVCLQYLHGTGRNLTTIERDSVCWYGDMGFGSHIWDLLGTAHLRAVLNMLPVIRHDSGLGRDEIATKAHQQIRQTYVSAKPTPVVAEDWRTYASTA